MTTITRLRSTVSYKPFLPGSDQPRPNRAQRRAVAQQRARGRRRMQRATTRAVRAASAMRPQLQEDMGDETDETTTVSVDLEEGTVTEVR